MTIGTRSASLTVLLTLMAGTALAQSIQGTATYRERMALPAAAVFEAVLEDVSRADAPAVTIAHTRLTSPGTVPITFTIARLVRCTTLCLGAVESAVPQIPSASGTSRIASHFYTHHLDAPSDPPDHPPRP